MQNYWLDKVVTKNIVDELTSDIQVVWAEGAFEFDFDSVDTFNPTEPMWTSVGGWWFDDDFPVSTDKPASWMKWPSE